MPSCSVTGCSNLGKHQFPKNPTLKKQWEIAIKRKNFVASVHSRLCREHFKESDYQGESAYTGNQQLHRFLKKGTVPSIFPWTKLSTTPSTPTEKLDFATAEYNKIEIKIEIEPEPNYDIDNIVSTAQPDPLSVSVEKQYVEASSQTGQYNQRRGVLSINAFRNNNSMICFYTGMETFEKFMLMFDTLCPMCYDLTYRESKVINVSPQEQLLITMIKLRRNMSDLELSFLFDLSSVTVSNIFITWVNFMYEIWSTINIWPDKDLVQFFMPDQFKKVFPSTRVIVDTTEIPIMSPSNTISQQATFSTNKHTNILKAMIGATPGGLISFVSECYSGSTSDRKIMETSNLQNMCESGDSIMADRGLNVQDLFVEKDIILNIPTVLKGKSQIPGVKLLNDRNLASKRIHIIAKTYRILKSKLNPYHMPLGSRILFVCAMACNFRENIMK